MDEEHKEGLW